MTIVGDRKLKRRKRKKNIQEMKMKSVVNESRSGMSSDDDRTLTNICDGRRIEALNNRHLHHSFRRIA